MSEIEKMMQNANVKQDRMCEWTCKGSEHCSTNCEHYESTQLYYPPFTAEKQIEIENVILQNKNNYNKWIEYNINVYGEWVIRFVRTDKFAPYIALGKTRAEAFANVVNHFWQDLTEKEKQQIKEILIENENPYKWNGSNDEDSDEPVTGLD